jgi:hypothetical protein
MLKCLSKSQAQAKICKDSEMVISTNIYFSLGEMLVIVKENFQRVFQIFPQKLSKNSLSAAAFLHHQKEDFNCEKTFSDNYRVSQRVDYRMTVSYY